MIVCYNHTIGDVLLLIVADNEGAALSFCRQENVSRVFRADNGKTVAWNVFESGLSGLTDGENHLSAEQITELNRQLASAGFSESVSADNDSHFVVAKIVESTAHPDSDHLHICQVDIGADSLVQIVCGAPNARVGLKTVAALPGTMMPDGKLIWKGSLRGVTSYGMLCAARELNLPHAPQKRGIIELSQLMITGEAFDRETMWQK